MGTVKRVAPATKPLPKPTLPANKPLVLVCPHGHENGLLVGTGKHRCRTCGTGLVAPSEVAKAKADAAKKTATGEATKRKITLAAKPSLASLPSANQLPELPVIDEDFVTSVHTLLGDLRELAGEATENVSALADKALTESIQTAKPVMPQDLLAAMYHISAITDLGEHTWKVLAEKVKAFREHGGKFETGTFDVLFPETPKTNMSWKDIAIAQAAAAAKAASKVFSEEEYVKLMQKRHGKKTTSTGFHIKMHDDKEEKPDG